MSRTGVFSSIGFLKPQKRHGPPKHKKIWQKVEFFFPYRFLRLQKVLSPVELGEIETNSPNTDFTHLRVRLDEKEKFLSQKKTFSTMAF